MNVKSTLTKYLQIKWKHKHLKRELNNYNSTGRFTISFIKPSICTNPDFTQEDPELPRSIVVGHNW